MQHLVTQSVPAERVVEVLRLLGAGAGAEGLAGGQVLALQLEGRDASGASQEELLGQLEVAHARKAASLLAASAAAGAMLAGASPSDCACVVAFATDLGMALEGEGSGKKP